jgi:hypothetical protein
MSSFKDNKQIFKENELSGSTPDIGVRTSLGGAHEKPRQGRVSAVESGEHVEVRMRDAKAESRGGGSSSSFTNRKSTLSAFKKVRSDVNLEALGSE